jgi:hypothetical protein
VSVEIRELLEIARKQGLEPVEQAAFHKIGTGHERVYVAKTRSGVASRVDLSGFSFKHPTIDRISRAEAARSHLGDVEAQIDCKQERDGVLDAFREALEHVKAAQPASAAKSTLPVPAPAVRIEGALLEALRREQDAIRATLPKGLSVDLNDTVRVLLWEAINERTATGGSRRS